MLCPYCRTDNIPGIEFCEECGADLAGLDTPEAAGGWVGRLMNDHSSDLDLSPPLTVSPDATVKEAVETMREERHGCLMVEEDGRVIGIFTERDLLSRVVRPGSDLASTAIRDVMTARPSTLSGDDPPAFGVHMMVSRGFRHLPVIDPPGKLMGFISVRNLLRHAYRDLDAH